MKTIIMINLKEEKKRKNTKRKNDLIITIILINHI